MIKKIIQHVVIILFLLNSLTYAHEIALTFDDLPGQEDESSATQHMMNARILQALKQFNAPAIGFVNESKLFSPGQTKEKIAILKLWIDSGHPLGNHTYHSLSNFRGRNYYAE